jgi:hypothetical protein
VLNIHNNNICEGVDESTGAGGMFGSRPVYPISVHHACMMVSYEHFGDWVTTSWLKRVWEKVSFFGFTSSVNNLLACYPQEGDDWLMSRFIVRGYTANELTILNCVQKHQQVLFLSVVAQWINSTCRNVGLENIGLR